MHEMTNYTVPLFLKEITPFLVLGNKCNSWMELNRKLSLCASLELQML
jgi:hypothetical protein